ALAEFERALIVERTRAGMTSARTRGRRLGRPRALTGAQLRKARDEIAADRETTASMATLLGVSRSTLWRALKDQPN
ncbi:recombinase family protein, partial [Sphingomonas sp. CFBP 13714]|nr:recombinase family protein [Sphingomonas sp. CFBP 13714]